jgi:hypothetical protein
MKKHTGMQCTVLCLLLNTIATSDFASHAYIHACTQSCKKYTVNHCPRFVLLMLRRLLTLDLLKCSK